MCDRMSPDATLALVRTAPGWSFDEQIVLTAIGVERLGELLLDIEQLMAH